MNNELFNQLSLELEVAARDYKQEVAVADTESGAVMLKLLAARCEKFSSEITRAFKETPGDYPKKEVSNEEARTLKRAKAQEIKEIFARVERRESRLESLYREVLRRAGGELPADLRELLERHQTLICKWHSFVITEEINFILAGEVDIPRELKEKSVNV